jgi:hypothetical protein
MTVRATAVKHDDAISHSPGLDLDAVKTIAIVCNQVIALVLAKRLCNGVTGSCECNSDNEFRNVAFRFGVAFCWKYRVARRTAKRDNLFAMDGPEEFLLNKKRHPGNNRYAIDEAL